MSFDIRESQENLNASIFNTNSFRSNFMSASHPKLYNNTLIHHEIVSKKIDPFKVCLDQLACLAKDKNTLLNGKISNIFTKKEDVIMD